MEELPTRDTRETMRRLTEPSVTIDKELVGQLSNLTREEQELLDEAWEAIPIERRRQLVRELSSQADEDFRLDFKAIFRRALRDGDAGIRRDAIEGLWEEEKVTLVRPLLRLLDDPDVEVQASAAGALGRFVLQGELGQLSRERYEQIVAALVARIEAPAQPLAVRSRAVESVAYSGDPRVRGIIARAYEDANDEMRVSALLAMGRSADEYWRGQVRGELHNPDPLFRLEAARAAGELGDGKAVPSLLALLRDVEVEVRGVALWALSQIGGPVARRALEEVVAGEQPPALRRQARDALAELALLEESAAVFSEEG